MGKNRGETDCKKVLCVCVASVCGQFYESGDTDLGDLAGLGWCLLCLVALPDTLTH